MHWNYRVTQQTTEGEELFAVREVYYDSSGRITGWTVDPADVVGDNIEEIRDALQRMLECLDKAVINITDEHNPTEGATP